ncbi:MAG: hypothetical protein JO108_14640 [Acidobacteriaceae bacterium]|nr:hypothetical protein [Acidobacteriaceae bacterium]
MRITLLTANLLLLSFSPVAQQTPDAALPPFQAKRLPPEKALPPNSGGLPPTADPLQLPSAAVQLPNLSGTAVPPDFKPKTDVALTKTAQDAVQMSEKWMAEHNQPFAGADGRVLYSYGRDFQL